MKLRVVSITIALFPVALIAQVGSTGRSIFEGKAGCIRCHSVDHRGGSLGPDLSEIGLTRTSESLRRSITSPDAEIDARYLTVVATTRSGAKYEGIALNEDDISIQMRDRDGNLHSFLKTNLSDIRREERSLMPSYARSLSVVEIDALVAWLRTLRGDTPPVTSSDRRRIPAPLTKNVSWITRANRDSQERPDTLLDNLGIRPGSTVADLGSGAGYFTWRLAQRVGTGGRVIAVDIQAPMLERTAEELKRHNVAINNVELVLGTDRDPRLPQKSVDLVLIANAYHEFSQPESMMAAVRRALKPAGRVAVIEYAEENDEDPTAGVYRMSLRQLRSEIEADGFVLDRILDCLPLQHAMIFVPKNDAAQ